MKHYILGAVFAFSILATPAMTQAAALTTQQANSLIEVVQSAPGVPASAFVNLITAFSNITVNQASSLIAVVQSSPSAPASAFVNLLISFTGDTTTTNNNGLILIPSTTFVNFRGVQGVYDSTQFYNVTFANGSSSSVNYTISVPNQPSWWNTGYNNETLTLNPGQVGGIGVLADASKVSSPGTYTANLVVTGNFANSPITIPVTLTVTGAASIASTPTITNVTYNAADGSMDVRGTGLNLNNAVMVDGSRIGSMIQGGPSWIAFIKVLASGRHSIQITNSQVGDSNMYYFDVVNQSTTTATLSVAKAGTGSGTVTTNVSPSINCVGTGPCSAHYENGASVTLTATPSTGSVFTGWSGNCSGAGTSCNVTVDSAKSVTATFMLTSTTPILGDVNGDGEVTAGDAIPVLQYTIGTRTLTSAQMEAADVNNDGKVTANDAKILLQYSIGLYASLPVSMKVGDVNNDGVIDSGDAVLVQQYVANQRTFTTLQQAVADVNNDNQITQADADTILAYSVGNITSLPVPYGSTVNTVPTTATLSVTKAGTGSGTVVNATYQNISCGATCTHSYTIGEGAALLAIPDAGSTFTSWSGACSGTGTCTVTMDAAKSVTATFTAAPTITLSSVQADSSGTISVWQGDSITLTGIPSNLSGQAGVDYIRTFNYDPAYVYSCTNTDWVIGCSTTSKVGLSNFYITVTKDGRTYTSNVIKVNVFLDQTASALNAFNSASQAQTQSSAQSPASFSYAWNHDLQIGSNGDDVIALQTALTKESVYAGEITGRFYNATFTAVEAFQQKYGIKMSGYVGYLTRTKLNELY